MHRRTVLGRTGVLLAAPLGGCLGGNSRAESPGNRIDDVVSDPPPELPLTPTVSVVSAESTADRPMRIAVKWENHQQETVRFGEERSVMFHAAGSDDERAQLLSDEYGFWEDTVSLDTCWYVSSEVSGDGSYQVGELPPGEARESELGLYAASDDCFTAGSYRFQNSISVWESPDVPDHPPTEEWGFVVELDSSGD